MVNAGSKKFFASLAHFEQMVGAYDRSAGNRLAVARGAVLGQVEPAPVLAENGRYAGIPTMVTPRELRLLHNYFSIHPTHGHVLEIGTYLGGSTAAIGRGLANSSFDGRYYAADSFSWPDPGFLRVLEHDFTLLGGPEAFSNEVAAEIGSGGWWLLFNEIHRNTSYRSFLNPQRWLIPQDGATANLDFLNPEDHLGAVFIDGFKSWAATYSGMQAIAPHIHSGTSIIFQDFSWIDCYWLPVLVTMCGDGLSLTHKVDNTAIFEVRSVQSVTRGLDAFGNRPNPDQFEQFTRILNNWATAQFHSGDDVGFLCHSAQLYILSHTMGQFSLAAEQLVFLKGFCERLNAGWLIDALDKSDFTILAA